jgi:hypothetical protein
MGWGFIIHFTLKYQDDKPRLPVYAMAELFFEPFDITAFVSDHHFPY